MEHATNVNIPFRARSLVETIQTRARNKRARMADDNATRVDAAPSLIPPDLKWARDYSPLYFEETQTASTQRLIMLDGNREPFTSPPVGDTQTTQTKRTFNCCGRKAMRPACISRGWQSWNATDRKHHAATCRGLKVYVKQQVKINNHAPANAWARLLDDDIDPITGLPKSFATPAGLPAGQQTLGAMKKKAKATKMEEHAFASACARLVLACPQLSWNFVTTSPEFWYFCHKIMELNFALFTATELATYDALCTEIPRPSAMPCANSLSGEKYTAPVLSSVRANVKKLFANSKEGGEYFVTFACDGWKDVAHRYMLVYSISTHDYEVFVATRDTNFARETEAELLSHLREVIEDAKDLIGDMKIGAICTDNAANMTKMASAYCAAGDGMLHFGCGSHTFDLFPRQLGKESSRDENGNLTVIQGVPAIRDLLVNVTSIITYIQNSKGATRTFKNNLANSSVDCKGFIKNSETRWSIAFFTLRRFVQLRPTLDATFSVHGNTITDAKSKRAFDQVKNICTPELFAHAAILRDLLNPLQRATSRMETKYATLASQFVLAKCIALDVQGWAKVQREKNSPWGIDVANAVLAELEKRNSASFEKGPLKPFFTHVHVAAYMLTVPRVLDVKQGMVGGDVIEIPGVNEDLHQRAVALIVQLAKEASKQAHRQWENSYDTIVTRILLAVANKARSARADIVKALKDQDAPIELSNTANAILELDLAQVRDVNRTFWMSDTYPKLPNQVSVDDAVVKFVWQCVASAAIQFMEVVPHSASVERLNSLQKRVHSEARNRMGAEKVDREMFISVNTRLLRGTGSVARRRARFIHDDDEDDETIEIDADEDVATLEVEKLLTAFFDSDDSLVRNARRDREEATDAAAIEALSDDDDVNDLINGGHKRQRRGNLD